MGLKLSYRGKIEAESRDALGDDCEASSSQNLDSESCRNKSLSTVTRSLLFAVGTAAKVADMQENFQTSCDNSGITVKSCKTFGTSRIFEPTLVSG